MEGLEQTARLLHMIRERGFKPGDKLPSERDLALEFSMSRSAVREGLIRLDTLRIIESRPKSGIYLQPYGAERSIEAMVLFAETNTPLSAAEVAQSVELRSVLETEALRLACARRTQEDLQRLQELLAQSEAVVKRGDSLADLDAEFHKAIVAATKNDVLLRFINVFYRMSRQRREIYFDTPMQSKRSHAQHLQLYRAIEQQDVEAGLRILRRHLKGVDTYFRMFFSEGPGAEAGAPPAATSSGRAAPGKGKAAPTRPKRASTRGGTTR
jgi:GntR family transcriptional regulator, transcriptional repressor for pyruvate dehydrogenase complex